MRSARVLRLAKEMGGDEVVTKSGLMVGLGESFEEMVEAFGILREHRVQVLTVGQYLRPTENHLPVVRYWHPDEFAALERPPTSSASSRSPPGRWSAAPATTPTRTCPRRRRSPASGEARWSQPGSNRRPLLAKAGALPAELWRRLEVSAASAG